MRHDFNEEPVLIKASTTMVGVLATPAETDMDPSRPAVLLLNAGFVHRAGPVRFAVTLARQLAQQGFVVLRYDSSGLGDSPTRTDGLPLEQAGVAETRDAMDFLNRRTGASSFVLCGLCSGAMFSYFTALQDERVVGLGLMNPRALDRNVDLQLEVASRNFARRYLRRITEWRSWRRALTGKVKYRLVWQALSARVKALGKRKEAGQGASSLATEMQQLVDRNVAILWLCSEEDVAIEYLAAIEQQVGKFPPDIVRSHTIAGADHTFTHFGHQDEALNTIGGWLADRWPARSIPDTATDEPAWQPTSGTAL